jgi:hypothetical protein
LIKAKSLPLSTLFTNPARKSRGYLAPVLSPIFAHHIYEGLILLISPRPLDHRGVKDLLPSVQALNISPVVEEGSNSFPVFGLKSKFYSCK